jgi:hypothetical protein
MDRRTEGQKVREKNRKVRTKEGRGGSGIIAPLSPSISPHNFPVVRFSPSSSSLPPSFISFPSFIEISFH